ncbi:cation ABC transporter periplasmic cation-binding protein, partial [Pseudomonas savastanoi pv. glycinea str. race 4]
ARLNDNVRDEQMREHLKAIEPLINTKVDGLEKLRSMSMEDQQTVARILVENKYVLDQLRELDVKVIFSEMDFPSTYVDTIQRESGVKLYPLSHISYGEYTADKYEKEMAGNLDTVVRAI